jgi:hypothetical protein
MLAFNLILEKNGRTVTETLVDRETEGSTALN